MAGVVTPQLLKSIHSRNERRCQRILVHLLKKKTPAIMAGVSTFLVDCSPKLRLAAAGNDIEAERNQAQKGGFGERVEGQVQVVTRLRHGEARAGGAGVIRKVNRELVGGEAGDTAGEGGHRPRVRRKAR